MPKIVIAALKAKAKAIKIWPRGQGMASRTTLLVRLNRTDNTARHRVASLVD